MINSFNLLEKFDLIEEYWSPKIVGTLNGQAVKIAKVKGDFIWHSHKEADELFMVMKGVLFIDLPEGEKVVNEGEVIIIPKGVEHRPRTSDKEVWIVMFEPIETLNTGEHQNEKTVTNLDYI